MVFINKTCLMKIIITEGQTKKLIDNVINEVNDTDDVSSFIDLIRGLSPSSGLQNVSNDYDSNFSDGSKLMHPLGHRFKISSKFGQRNGHIGSKNHKGIDISAPSGTKVYAPTDGKIIEAKDTTPNGCGGFVMIDHGNIKTKFCHLRQWVVNRGDIVKKGQLIGYSGGDKTDPYRGTSSGPHLHYEILNQSGIAMNPTDIQTNLA